MSAENTTADAEQSSEERQEYPWVNQTPTTEITGEPVELIFGDRLDENTEQTGTSFGVVLRDPEVRKGTLFVNEAKPDGDVTREAFEDASPSDYRLVDPSDQSAKVVKGALTTDERGSNVYDEAASFDEEEVLVWYNGMSGQILGRALDFNGLPFAEYKEDGYLVKGLLQVADGWRNRANRKSLVQAGKAPRIVRAPVLRRDVAGERITITIGRYNGGRMYEAHAYMGDSTDEDDELEMLYAEDADDVLDEVEYGMHLFHGDGWQDRPANAAPDFGISVDTEGDSDDVLNVTQRAFVEQVAKALDGTALTPDEAFEGGVSGLMQQHGVEGDTDLLTTEIFKAVAHLDADDL